MKIPFWQPPVPSLGKLALWSLIFASRAASTLPTLMAEVSRTALQTTSHDAMNSDQRWLLSQNPEKIAVLVPGFQLDGTSLFALKKAFNDKNIPALFPESLPFGIDAVLFRQHPQILVAKIVEYIQKIQKQHSSEIILVGHSFWGTEALHATNLINTPWIVPVTLSGLLEPVGLMAYAPHALYYRQAAHIFSWDDEDQFIRRTQFMQLGVDEHAQERSVFKNHIAVVNPGDGYLPLSTQAGVFGDNFNNSHVLVPSQRTPRHYLQWKNPLYARDLIGAILWRLEELKSRQ